MRIHRITLRDFRGVADTSVAPAPTGVTIIEGPNEVGKSSIADALDMLISDPDSSVKSRVKASQPIGRDVGPRVEADLEAGPYRFTYAKQWVKGAATELRITAPAPEQLTGRAAHDRVMEILGEAMDLPLFAALRHQQGMPLNQAALAESGSLARALDLAAGGGSRAAEGDGDLIAAIDAERQEFSTPTGEPNKRRRELREHAAVAEEAVRQAEEAVREVDARADDHQRLRAAIDRSREQEPALRADVRRLEELQAAVLREASALRDLDIAAERAQGPVREARAAAEARADLVRQLNDAERQEAALADEARAAGGRLAAAIAARDAAGEALARASAAREVAAAEFARADADDGHLRNEWDLRDLRERRQRVGAADETIRDAEAFIADCAVDDDLLRRLEQAVLDEAGARGRAQGAGARLRVSAARDLVLRAGEEAHAIVAGTEAVIPLGAGEPLDIPGVARIAVEGAGEEVREEARRALEERDALLEEAGAKDGIEAARAQARRRRDEEARARSAREARSAALNDLTPEEMEQKIARAEERVAGYLAGRAQGAPMPADRDEARQRRARADDALAEARRAEDAARHALDAAREDVGLQEREAAERTGHLGATVESVRGARAALDDARAVAADEVIAQVLRDAESAAAAAAGALDEARAAMHPDDPDAVQARLANARDAVDRLIRERSEMEVQAARMLGEIASAGEEGRADRLDRARAARDDARVALAAAERRAAAADLLFDVVTRHRDDARRAYVAPFRDAVEHLGRLVFGPGVTFEVDHATLQVISRSADGATVPVDALSGGAREQLAVIGRLAAASLVSDDAHGGAPVIIDDALGYSDPERLEGLGAALAEAGRRSQVIVLTCMPERYARIGSACTIRL